MYGCQQVLISPDSELKAVLEYICSESNKLYNCGLYYARQIYFQTNRLIGKFELDKEIKSNIHFQALRSCAAQQTLRSVHEGMKSYWSLRRKWFIGEIENKPRLPLYRKKGFYQITYPRRFITLDNNQLIFSMGRQAKAWFGIKNFQLAMPSNLKFSEIREVRIVPRNGCFYAEFVYQVEKSITDLDSHNVLAIDHGVDNWLTCVSNRGDSFIIDGKHLKSLNHCYNKKVSRLKENKPQGFWNKKLACLTEKRNRQMRDAVNKAARLVINHCLNNQIGVIIFGWNKRQKDGSNMGRKNNQEFVSIPTARLKNRIAQLCEQYGIQFFEQEESYTSLASYLDGDLIPKYGEKPEGWQPSGKRIFRGLYRSKDGLIINADCQGAANIIRKKVSTTLIDFSRVSMGVLSRPQRIKIWSAKKTVPNVVLTR